jgi:hypothetical protein
VKSRLRQGLRLSAWLRSAFIACVACAAAPAGAAEDKHDAYMQAMRDIAEGRPNQAREILTLLIENEPQHAGAWLDLAILQCELGHGAEAERLFAAIASRFAPPPAIMEVIAQRRAQGCASWQASNTASLTIGRGRDTNANQGTTNPNFSIGNGETRLDFQLLPEYLSQRDQFSSLSGEFSRSLNADGSTGFIQFQARHNDVLSRYNMASLVAGADHPWRLGSWNLRGTANLGALTLGGRLYQEQQQLQLRVSPPLSLPDPWQFSVLTGLSHLRYTTLANYDANIMEVRGLLAYGSEKINATASVGHVLDRAIAQRPGGSRHGWAGSVQGRMRVHGEVVGELGWSGQTWISDTAYSPGLIDQIRNQKTHTLKAALVFPLDKDQSVILEWRGVRNWENISLFENKGHLLQLSWQWRHF